MANVKKYTMIAAIHIKDDFAGARLIDLDTFTTEPIGDTGKTKKFYRYVSVESAEIIKFLRSGAITITNLALNKNGELKGVGGDLSRYSVIDADSSALIGTKAWTVLGKTVVGGKTGFKLVDPSGITGVYAAKDIIERGINLTNGKVVQKGNNYSISSITGSYEQFDLPQLQNQVQRQTPVPPEKGGNAIKDIPDAVPLAQPKFYEQIETADILSAKQQCELAYRYKSENSSVLEKLVSETDKTKHETCDVKWLRVLMSVRVLYPLAYNLLCAGRSGKSHMTFSDDIQTMGVNMHEFIISPKFVAEHTESELLFVLLHEARHLMLGHPIRLNGRNPWLWNIAADYVVNSMIAHELSHDYYGRYLPEKFDANGQLDTENNTATPLQRGKTVKFENVNANLPISEITMLDSVLLDLEHVDGTKRTTEEIYAELLAKSNQYSYRMISNEEADKIRKEMKGSGQWNPNDDEDQQQGQQGQQQGQQGQQGQQQGQQPGQQPGQQGQQQPGQSGQPSQQVGQQQGQQSAGAQGQQPGQQGQQSAGAQGQGGQSAAGAGSPGMNATPDANVDAANNVGSWVEVTATDADGNVVGRWVVPADIDITNGDSTADGKPANGVSSDALDRIRDAEYRDLLSRSIQDPSHSRGVIGSPQMDRIAEIRCAPHVNWKTLMQRFLQLGKSHKTSYQHPDRRFVARDVILPGHSKSRTHLKDVLVGVDTSGSITDEDLGIVAGHLWNLCKTYDCKMTIVWWDTEVAGIQKVEKLKDIKRLSPKGHGGTKVNSFLEWYAAHLHGRGGKDGIDPSAVLIITDGYIEDPKDILRVQGRDKFLWLISSGGMDTSRFEPPYGRKVYYDPKV